MMNHEILLSKNKCIGYQKVNNFTFCYSAYFEIAFQKTRIRQNLGRAASDSVGVCAVLDLTGGVARSVHAVYMYNVQYYGVAFCVPRQILRSQPSRAETEVTFAVHSEWRIRRVPGKSIFDNVYLVSCTYDFVLTGTAVYMFINVLKS